MTDGCRFKYLKLESGKKSTQQGPRYSILVADGAATLHCEACKQDIVAGESPTSLPGHPTRIPRLKTSSESPGQSKNKNRDKFRQQTKHEQRLAQEKASPTTARDNSNLIEDALSSAINLTELLPHQEKPAQIVTQQSNVPQVQQCSVVVIKESDLIQDKISSIVSQAESKTPQEETSPKLLHIDSNLIQEEVVLKTKSLEKSSSIVGGGKSNLLNKETSLTVVHNELNGSKEKKTLTFASLTLDTSQEKASPIESLTLFDKPLDIYIPIIARAQSKISPKESLIEAVTDLSFLDEKIIPNTASNESNMCRPQEKTSTINVAKSDSVKDFMSKSCNSKPKEPPPPELDEFDSGYLPYDPCPKLDPVEPETLEEQISGKCPTDGACQQDSQSGVPQNATNNSRNDLSVCSSQPPHGKEEILARCPTDGPCQEDSQSGVPQNATNNSRNDLSVCSSQPPQGKEEILARCPTDGPCQEDSQSGVPQNATNNSQNDLSVCSGQPKEEIPARCPTDGPCSPKDSGALLPTSCTPTDVTKSSTQYKNASGASKGTTECPGMCTLPNDVSKCSCQSKNIPKYTPVSTDQKLSKTVSTECPGSCQMIHESKSEQTDLEIAEQPLKKTKKTKSRSKKARAKSSDTSLYDENVQKSKAKKRCCFKKYKKDAECPGGCMLPSDVQSGPFPNLCNAIKNAFQCIKFKTEQNESKDMADRKQKSKKDKQKKVSRPKYKKVKGKKTKANAPLSTIKKNGQANCCACCGLIADYLKEICNMLCLKHICDTRFSQIMSDMLDVAGCLCNDCYVFVKRLCGSLLKK